MSAFRNRTGLAALTAVLAAALAAGCSIPERICRSEEYPVKAVGNKTGAACVADGEDPPAGYVKYPAGKVPEHVGDKWDVYWKSVVVDETGAIVGD